MNSIVYKNPTISAILINLLTLIISIYLIYQRELWFCPLLAIVGITNRKIIDNGKNITKLKKALILTSFFLFLISFLAYSKHMYDIRLLEIIHKL